MLRKKHIIFCLLFFLIFLPSLLVEAQVSVNVSPLDLDRTYRDIDKLVSHGLIDRIIVGQKPYSRKEIARLTGEAIRHLPLLENQLFDPNISEKKKESVRKRISYIQNILQRLKNKYQEELTQLGYLEGEKSWYSAHPLEKVNTDIILTNSPPLILNNNNGIGSINAIINPLIQYREGRRLIDGNNFLLETSHWLRASDHFALYVKPSFQLAFSRENDQANNNNIYLLNLYGKFYVKNFEIEIGRDNLMWGQGENAGLLLSTNPRGLDMVKISNDSPFFLPSVLKYIGPVKFSFFYSDLGPSQNFPNAYLAGYKLSFEPVSFFEFGLALYDQAGGKGSPSTSFGGRVSDLFPFVHVFTDNQTQIGNKLGGLDFRLRIPPIHYSELYGEIILDDFHHLNGTQLQDTGFLFGIYMPRLTTSGNVDLRLEYHRTGARFYRHEIFTSGLTLNNFILGDNLGPEAQGGYLTIQWDITEKNMLSFYQAFEFRGNDLYNYVADPYARIYKTQNFPKEDRYRFITTWFRRFEDFPLIIKTEFGYERVQNFQFISGNDRNNFLGEINLQFNFDQLTKKQ